MNFKLIEGEYNNIEDDFVELYNNGVKIKDIINQLNITYSKYQSIFHKMVQENRITLRKPRQENELKNIYYHKKNKSYGINRKGKYYTSFKSIEEAKKYKKLMDKINWDFERRYEIKAMVTKNVIYNKN